MLSGPNPVLWKKYFIADTLKGHNSAFKNHTYKLLDSTNLQHLFTTLVFTMWGHNIRMTIVYMF